MIRLVKSDPFRPNGCAGRPPCRGASAMRQSIGWLLQLASLAFLPALIYWQLNFGFRLVVMPALTLGAIVVFWIGTKLRETA
jgi:hypothetical protein